MGLAPVGIWEVCACLPLLVDRIRAPELACLLPGVACVEGGWRGGRGQEQGVFSHPGSLRPSSRRRVQGGLGGTSGLLAQKVLEHGLLSVPFAEVLPLSGPGFLCEVPVLHLRFRVLSPSPSKPQVCRPVSGVAQRGLRRWPCCGRVKGGVLLGNQALSRVRALDLAGEFAAMALTLSLGPGTLRN